MLNQQKHLEAILQEEAEQQEEIWIEGHAHTRSDSLVVRGFKWETHFDLSA